MYVENQETFRVPTPVADPQLPCNSLIVNTCLSFSICNLTQEREGGDTYLTGLVVGIKVLL